MKDVVTGKVGSSVSLTSAILLYESPKGACFATVHPVEVPERSGRAVIGAGRPVSREALLQALRALNENAAAKAAFLPSTVLGLTSQAVTWWCAPAPRRVFFRCEELGTRTAVVPHPGLVFQASIHGFRVFSVKNCDRPGPDTPLFEPPYFNTWNDGLVCIGSARVPVNIDVDSISGWESGFFESEFTHPNHGGRRIAYEKGEFAFWRDMLDGRFEAFPLDALVPTNETVLDLINARGDA
ncbi:PRTRC system protein B [Burkholderia multivorans]|uniref:PRTRC system protein B n=1 Tax=Burkholderia multivorans TaxID=87883 RepID=UPI001C237944|nr:PRTRC system protein B [Burkholderia multivorans]MBU9212284.1 PRTRC system protein B [Burkholderia multivorans]